MSLILGSVTINGLWLGSTEIRKAYLGATLVYDRTGGGTTPGDALLQTVSSSPGDNVLLSTTDELDPPENLLLSPSE